MTITEDNRDAWEKRSQLCGASLKGVLFKGLPDVLNEHIHKWHVGIILDAIQEKENLRVLDVGCGYGRLSIPLIERYPNIDITGIDISENYANLYKQHAGRPAFARSVEDIPPELGAADAILCVTVLMYLDPEAGRRALSNLLALLKPDGKLILIENHASGVPFTTAFGLRTLFRRSRPQAAGGTGGRAFGKNEMQKMAALSNARILRQLHMPATTLAMIPLWIAAKILPLGLTHLLLKLCRRTDQLLGNLKLPSVHVAYIMEKG